MPVCKPSLLRSRVGKTDATAKPPRRRKWYFRIEYKQSAMSLKDGVLKLSNGRGNASLVLDWPWEVPQTVVIHWTGIQYEAIATYKQTEPEVQPTGDRIAGIDLGEVHIAASHDGEQTHILNGRLLRYKYRGEFGVPHVVAGMAPATGIRFAPHARVARSQLRENVCVGNCTEAARL